MSNFIIEFCEDPVSTSLWEPNLVGQTFPTRQIADEYVASNCIQNNYWSLANFRVIQTIGTPVTASPIDPAHYTELDPEPIDVIEKWGLNFRLANVIKYIARNGRKPGEDAEGDLRKARNYLNREINAIDGKRSW